jgi:DNA (cytosine-5)-methyltransferase 1
MVPNLGDMTTINQNPIANERPIDLLVGGTPCQSFSVAGLRKGLADPRGNLMLTFLSIADKFRPKWVVWENVPGVLSSNGGKDFGTFLGALGELGYGFAYRVLDAQHFGVAQRRRRVFVVGYLGDWKPAAERLFESESLSGDIKQSRKARQETANSFIPSVVGTLDTECGGGRKAHQSVVSGHFIPTFWNGGQTAECLTAKGDDQRMPDKNRFQAVLQNTAVRRLTEVECERLQGFPDNYTNIKENCPSGVRYKALGNSMAVPVMRWIGERINSYETMRSSAVVQVETGMGLAEV